MKNKTFRLLTIISVIILFASCQKVTINTGKDERAVALYDCSEKANGATICFDSLLMDSRCPAGSECIWQGTAIIKITFSENGNSHPLTLSLKGFPGLGHPSDTAINGYRISFIDLKPYPDANHPSAKKPIAFFKIF